MFMNPNYICQEYSCPKEDSNKEIAALVQALVLLDLVCLFCFGFF